MTMFANITGRAVFNAKQRTSKAGKAMTSVRVAVNVTAKNTDQEQSVWMDVLTFGEQAARAVGIEKGQTVAAIGRVTRREYVAANGERRESWTTLADTILCAAQPRPASGQRAPQPAAQAPMAGGDPYSDDIPF